MSHDSIFAACRGVNYVLASSSGIEPLVIAIDGLRLTSFDGDARPHLRLDDVISWHETELAATGGRSGDRQLLDVFKAARARFAEEDRT